MATNWQQILLGDPVAPSGTGPAAPRASTLTGPYVPRPRATGWERGLDAALIEKVQQLQALAAREGIPLQIKQGYRSPEEQERLYAQGRTTPGDIVTYKRAGTSSHQTGRAVDVVPLTDGKPDEKSPHWGRIGELGKSLGLRWGGDFKTLKDRFHFELPRTAAAVSAPAPPAATGLTPQQQALAQRIRTEALRQGVPPDYAVAVARQESSLNPHAVGDQGKSLGLFQLQAPAAIDAGIDPARRQEVDLNITGGVRYLKQGLDRFGGDFRQALEKHYNRGGDPDYYAHVMQYVPGGPARRPARAAAAPRDWGTVFGLTGAPEPAAAVTEWGSVFGLTSVRPPTPAAAPGSESPRAPAAGRAPPDWGQILGFT